MNICVAEADFNLELPSRRSHMLVQWGSGWRAGAWGSDGHSLSCPGPSSLTGPCLLTVEWHHQGGPLSPFLGALKFCTQRLRGAPISTSEWTQHFWKSLTRLNHGAISCQSTHTSCFSEPTEDVSSAVQTGHSEATARQMEENWLLEHYLVAKC